MTEVTCVYSECKYNEFHKTGRHRCSLENIMIGEHLQCTTGRYFFNHERGCKNDEKCEEVVNHEEEKSENKKRVCLCCGKELMQHENMNFAICLTSGCPANFFNNFIPVAEWEMRVNRELEECLKKRNLNNIDEINKRGDAGC